MAAEAKAFEARWAVEHGATEIDMVISVGLLKSQQWRAVLDDIEEVRAVCPPPVRLKVILENVLLTDAEKVQGCLLSVAAGADFVKTSTGFSKGGATVDDVALMRRVVGRNTGVKAAGGIHTTEEALAMIMAGADRIGASQTGAILDGLASLQEGK
jgi:deoxyribose-phosphate aldolase